MGKKVYGLFNSDKKVEEAVAAVTRANHDGELTVIHGKSLPGYGASDVSPAGLYPNGIDLGDGNEYIFELSDEKAEFVRRQLNNGMSLVVAEINGDEGALVSAIRSLADHAFTEEYGLNLGSNEAGSNDPVDVLNRLIALCHDGIEGYKAAAERTEKEIYQRMFNEYVEQRQRFVNDLQKLVRNLGGNPEDSGSFLGSLHEGWLRFRSYLAGDEQEAHAVLEEARRGEEAVLEAYQEAFHGELPESVRPIIRTHLSEINVAYERMKALSNVTE